MLSPMSHFEKKEIMNELISVVIPVYNHAQFVERALHSVINQSYPKIEIIIIDDGSKDNSAKIIEKVLKDKKNLNNREILFFQQENQGAHATINRGLSIAKGDWLTILNSDDFYDSMRLEKLMAKVKAGKAEMAFSFVVPVDEKDQILSQDHWWWRWYEGAKYQLFQKDVPTIGFQLLQDNIAVSTGNLFFSRSLYNEVGPFKDLKLAHDLDFILRSLVISEPLLVREELYYYRLHQTNTQHSVKHLMEKEKKEIYREYLVRTSSSTHIKNPMAPCPWFWPSEFSAWRNRLKMNDALNAYIYRPQKKDHSGKKKSVQKSGSKGKQITLISHNLTLSGAPKVIADLAFFFKGQGYRPNVIALSDGPMRKVLEEHGIPVVAPTGGIFKRMMQLPWILLRHARKWTVINTPMSFPALVLLSLFYPFHRMIWYLHDSYTPSGLFQYHFGGKSRLFIPILKLLRKKKSLHLCFGSKNTQDIWKHSQFEKGKVMYWSGIAKNESKRLPNKRLKHFLSVGTASARKGTFHLLDAFIDCLNNKTIHADSTLTIIGFSPLTQTSSSHAIADAILKVIASGYKDQIHLITSLDPRELNDYYNKADIFVQASILECLPISLLEAMSKGMPIISTDVNGCPEAIQHLKTGYICLPYNKDSLAEAMTELAKDPEKSLMMGDNAQKKFNEQFSLEVTSEKFLENLKVLGF